MPARCAITSGCNGCLDVQLARGLAAACRCVQDLPIGMNPGGADAWEWQDLLAQDISVGAPPDAFNPDGQDWQLPPLVPWKLRAAGYEPFVADDPRRRCGMPADCGSTTSWACSACGGFPRASIRARAGTSAIRPTTCWASWPWKAIAAGAFVVGEDLGTVEPGVRERLAARRVMSCRLLWFEPRPPAEYPPLSMAAVTTHDLPTIAGLWSGADLAAQRAIGMPHSDEMCTLAAAAGREAGPRPTTPRSRSVIERAYRCLAEAPSLLVTATLDDAQAVEERPNMPGTIDQWPNWSLALPQTVEEMEAAELPRRIARARAA